MNTLLLLVSAYLALTGTSERYFDRNDEGTPAFVPNLKKVTPQEWHQYKNLHNKSYEGKLEEPLRRLIFAENKHEVSVFNELLSHQLGFSLALNHLADLSSLEMKQRNGFRFPEHLLGADEPLKNEPAAQAFLDKILQDDEPVPDAIDWREVPGRVSPVKNQGSCGSCWAFASTGALEGQEKVRSINGSSLSGALVELSEQNLVDCVTKDAGCNGGYMADALEFVKQEGGIDDEKSYPYEARTRKCRFNKANVAFSDTGAAILPTGDEQALKKVVAKFGPVAVAIDASSIWFQLYRKGVYYNKRCKNKEDQLDHGVLVVGYGTDPKKGDYWIVKNSWGGTYGEKGYIRMARNRNNNCGIATVATIPTF